MQQSMKAEKEPFTRYMWIVLAIVSASRLLITYNQSIVSYTMPFLANTFRSDPVELSSAVAVAGIGNLAQL